MVVAAAAVAVVVHHKFNQHLHQHLQDLVVVLLVLRSKVLLVEQLGTLV